MSGDQKDLATLREKIRDLDEQMLRLIADRIDLAREVGKYKLDNNLPIKDFKVEKDIIEKARVRARTLGVYEQLVEDILKLQMKYSVMAQEEFHTRSRHSTATGKKIVIVGGLGKMGLWLAQFFDSFGHQVTIHDRAPAESSDEKLPYKLETDLKLACKDQDFIVLATPISQTSKTLSELIDIKPEAIIFDICSLKTPILEQICRAQEAGLQVSSIHPMFGPNTDILAGKNIVFCRNGNDSVKEHVRSLFDGTTANLIDIDLKEHDNLMSIVLGLSHFVNLSFAKTLADSNLSSSVLRTVASSTFRSQLDVTIPVVSENQDLYYEIQAENAHTESIVASMIKSMNEYLDSIAKKDRKTFRKLMDQSKKYLVP